MEFLADNGRPIAFTAVWAAVVTSLGPLLNLFLSQEAAGAILGVLAAIGPLLGFYIPRRSNARKVALVGTDKDPALVGRL